MSKSNVAVLRANNGGFTRVPTELIRSPLSSNAFRMLCFALSLPEDWEFSIGGSAAVLPLGKSAIRAALSELETAGYLRREQCTDTAGRFAGYRYEFCDAPSTANRSPISRKRTAHNRMDHERGFEWNKEKNQHQIDRMQKDLKKRIAALDSEETYGFF